MKMHVKRSNIVPFFFLLCGSLLQNIVNGQVKQNKDTIPLNNSADCPIPSSVNAMRVAHIYSQSSNCDFQVDAAGVAGGRFIIKAGSGYVGINNANPQAPLDMIGDAYFTVDKDIYGNDIEFKVGNNTAITAAWMGTITKHGLFIGTYKSGSNLYLDTSNNVFLGHNAGLPTVSSALLLKNDLFVQNGVIAADYTMAPSSAWSDYVFEKNYGLKPLSEVAAFIDLNKHLPNIPSQKEVEKDGYSIGEMNVKFLEKIEELTLYVIEQDKESKLQQAEIKDLQKQLQEYKNLKAEVEQLKMIIQKNK